MEAFEYPQLKKEFVLKENINEIFISSLFIKLDQLLKFSSIAQTGAMAKEMILDGRCIIEGNPCFSRGKKLFKGDFVFVFVPSFNIDEEDEIAVLKIV